MKVSQIVQIYLDKIAPLKKERWCTFGVIFASFVLRILWLKKFYLIAYCVSIYLLHGLIGFLTPGEDSIPDPFDDQYDDVDVNVEYNNGNRDIIDDEFRPFIRRLPEYSFWMFSTKLMLLSLIATYFEIFNIPVYPPVLIFYFFVMSALTARKLYMHMKKYKYNPFFMAKDIYKANK